MVSIQQVQKITKSLLTENLDSIMDTRTLEDVANRKVNLQGYDLAFVGSGASTSYTIIALCQNFYTRNNKPFRVLVIEDSGELHAGMAYGRRSGKTALTLTRLDQFYPYEELKKFARWVRNNRRETDIWQSSSESSISELSALPLKHFVSELGTQCAPRMLVGEFITWRVNNALDSLPSDTGLRVDFLHAKVLELKQNESSVCMILKDISANGSNKIYVKDVILAFGGRPRQSLKETAKGLRQSNPCIIDCPYSQEGLDNNIRQMMDQIKSTRLSDPRILILGSNASAMEAIYILNRYPPPTSSLITIRILSRLGELPENSSTIIDNSKVSVTEIDECLDGRIITSDMLYAAALKGLKRLKIEGLSVESYNRSVDVSLLNAIEKMENEELLKFLREKANSLGRHKRRMATAYHNITDHLLNEGRLKIESANVLSVRVIGSEITVEVGLEGGEVKHIKAEGLINCGGPEPLNINSSNPLIASLIKSGMVHVDKSGTCFNTTDGAFKVAENIYVIGPLLAGNIVNKDPVWHLEHCGRIIKYSEQLALMLLKRLNHSQPVKET